MSGKTAKETFLGGGSNEGGYVFALKLVVNPFLDFDVNVCEFLIYSRLSLNAKAHKLGVN